MKYRLTKETFKQTASIFGLYLIHQRVILQGLMIYLTDNFTYLICFSQFKYTYTLYLKVLTIWTFKCCQQDGGIVDINTIEGFKELSDQAFRIIESHSSCQIMPREWWQVKADSLRTLLNHIEAIPIRNEYLNIVKTFSHYKTFSRQPNVLIDWWIEWLIDWAYKYLTILGTSFIAINLS